MKTIIEQILQNAVSKLKTSQAIPGDINPEIKIERTRDTLHGDFATSIALIMAKRCRQSPRQVAQLIVEAIEPHDSIERVEIAGPGFINFFIRKDSLSQIVSTVLDEGDAYGTCNIGNNQKVLLEFVSANPTGPLHVGHGRGAAYGASLANVLKAAGYAVSREYYVNDAGRQMNILAVSVWLRYLELAEIKLTFPTNAYRGDYVHSIAEQVRQKEGALYIRNWEEISANLPLDEPEGGDKEKYIDALIDKARQLITDEGFKLFHQYALNSVLSDIKEDLHEFGVNFDIWFSEQQLLDDGSINKGIESLKATGKTYMKEGALWFKATDFGDEKDRVLIRANGNTTYFASDVAYHWNKYERGFDRVIDIFGADHHGYITRVKAAVNALGHDENALTILLVQFAILYRGNERVQMSTRSGSFVTLRDLREEVGKDAARFFYVVRKPEQHMDFDLDLAKSESNDNPVYYIQYAHARISSVLRQLHDRGLRWDETLGRLHIEKLTEIQEQALLTLISRYPEVIVNAANFCEPHQLAYYLRELATGLHSYYNAVQLLCENELLRNARLCLLKAVRQVLKNGLTLLGVTAPESM